jgi:hypothetical protein
MNTSSQITLPMATEKNGNHSVSAKYPIATIESAIENISDWIRGTAASLSSNVVIANISSIIPPAKTSNSAVAGDISIYYKKNRQIFKSFVVLVFYKNGI